MGGVWKTRRTPEFPCVTRGFGGFGSPAGTAPLIYTVPGAGSRTGNPQNMESDVDATTNEPESFRQPPGNVEAEMGLLGAILGNNHVHARVSDFLEPRHFSDPIHRKVYEFCEKLIESQQPASPTTLKHFLDGPEFQQVGGHRYLAELARASFTIVNAEHYGRLIYDHYLRRELIEIGTDVVNRAYSRDPDDAALGQIETAEQHLFNLATTGSADGGFQSFSESIEGAVEMAANAFNRESAYAGVATGFKHLDLRLGGMHKSDLVVLAGRPGMGKTALATNIAFNVASNPGRFVDDDGAEKPVDSPVVGFFSLEMSSQQLATRVLAENAEIASDSIRRGELNQNQFDRLVQASQRLQTMPLYIDDTPALTIAALRTRARRLKRRTDGLGLIVVDYLQLLQPSRFAREASRVQEISEITRGLKTLAKELDVPVLALSQLSRAVEQRDDKRPQLADLRESGTIEQDADVVMFIYREEYYLQNKRPERSDLPPERLQQRQQQWDNAMEAARGKADVIIAKSRHGPTDTVSLRFYAEATKFDDLEDADGHPEGPPPDVSQL